MKSFKLTIILNLSSMKTLTNYFIQDYNTVRNFLIDYSRPFHNNLTIYYILLNAVAVVLKKPVDNLHFCYTILIPFHWITLSLLRKSHTF